MSKQQLPALADLHHDVQVAFKNDQLKLLLNQPPHSKWIKKHPIVKAKDEQGKMVAASYLPIDKVEFLMDRIFQEWKVEVLREGVMFQSVYVTIRLHYKDPITGEWRFHDGVGAKSVQTDSGFSAADLAHIKDAAVMMALPSAKSYAIKDAAEHLGKLFGKDLNRVGTMEFSGSYTPTPTPTPTSTEEFPL
jgi:hypothetical protein